MQAPVYAETKAWCASRARASLVREDVRRTLSEVPVSLSGKISDGVSDFADMGLEQAYAGAPARATEAHGREMIECLAQMVATEVCESIGVDLQDSE